MNTVIDITIDQIKAERTGVLQTQGIPPDISPPPQVEVLYESAEKLFSNLAAPIGMMADISTKEFGEIYNGDGLNATETPLKKIFPRATSLALFAFTLGMDISRNIEKQLKSNNLALGYMLDAVASFSADKASLVAQELFLNRLIGENSSNISLQVLLYSPGYCGWDISGQRKLFDYLKPERIGIHLNERFLMVPLKSISGVLVAGETGIHRFNNNYPFCGLCTAKTCRERINA